MLSTARHQQLIRTTLTPSDISFRAITYLHDELLYDIPETGDTALSLFQGFRASLSDPSSSTALRNGSKSSHHHQTSTSKGQGSFSNLQKLQRDRDALAKDLEIVTIR